MNKISLLIVEDELETQKEYKDTSEKYNDTLNVIGITGNSSNAIDIISKTFPDAIILDLDLTEGEGNGFDILYSIKTLKYKPFIVVCTYNSSKIIQDTCTALGVDFIYHKYQKNYHVEDVFKFIISLKNTLNTKLSSSSLEYENIDVINKKNKQIEDILVKEFSLIGMRNNKLGYRYFIDAIKLKVQNHHYERKDLIEIIAKSNNKSPDSIAHAMQRTIDHTWRNSDSNDLLEHYAGYIDPDIGAPTITEFINNYAVKVKNNINL